MRVKTIFLGLFLIALLPLSFWGGSFEVKEDGFYKNNQKYQIISGTIDYARIPKSHWNDRLLKARAMGLNTITTHVFWNFHEEIEGIIDFATDTKDLATFLTLAKNNNLNVILRVGPYVDSNWDLGGLPSWLLAKTNIQLRTSDPKFLGAAKNFIISLMECAKQFQITNDGPIILLQIENNYGAYGRDDLYLKKLCKIFTLCGASAPLISSNLADLSHLKRGSVDELLPTITFESKAKEAFELLSAFSSKPFMASDYFIARTSYGDQLSGSASPSFLRIKNDLTWMLKNGKSFNLTPFASGTNFAFSSGSQLKKFEFKPTTTTAYFDSLLDESGAPTAKYNKIRAILKKYQNSSDSPLPDVPKQAKPGKATTAKFTQFVRIDDAFENVLKKVPTTTANEYLGQNSGLVFYRTKLDKQKAGKLIINSPRDKVHVILDGKYVKTISRNDSQNKVKINISSSLAKKEPTLILVVEQLGHLSSGPDLIDRKGIINGVTLNDANIMEWEVLAVPFTEEFFADSIKWTPDMVYNHPAFFLGTFNVSVVGDIYFDTYKWSSGIVVVNGHNLGRYTDGAKQNRLYCPADYLHKGINSIFVYDEDMEFLPSMYIKQKP